MPDAFYADWARVAREEGLHFSLLRAHLRTLGYDYGDMPAHDGLWEMAERTKEDLLARLALVPRTLEARGLDASPVVRRKLADAGDLAAAGIIDISCAMKSAMWRRAIAGIATYAQRAGWTRWPRFANWPPGIARPSCGGLSTCQRGARQASVTKSWRRC